MAVEKPNTDLTAVYLVFDLLKMKISDITVEKKAVDGIRELYVVWRKVFDKYVENFEIALISEKIRRRERSEKDQTKEAEWAAKFHEGHSEIYGTHPENSENTATMKHRDAIYALAFDKAFDELKRFTQDFVKWQTDGKLMESRIIRT